MFELIWMLIVCLKFKTEIRNGKRQNIQKGKKNETDTQPSNQAQQPNSQPNFSLSANRFLLLRKRPTQTLTSGPFLLSLSLTDITALHFCSSFPPMTTSPAIAPI